MAPPNMNLWQSGRCDEQAHVELQEILSRCPLSGRLIHGFPEARCPGFGRLLSADEWMRLSRFGTDALSSFLGKDARGNCLELGRGKERNSTAYSITLRGSARNQNRVQARNIRQICSCFRSGEQGYKAFG